MKSKLLLNFSLFGIIQFFLLTLVAMYVFPGGTIFDANVESYSFLNNFFSDLGRTADFEGNNNPSQLIFTIALIMVSLSMLSFFIVGFRIFYSTKFKKISLMAIFFGVIASICYTGIAFTPWDILKPAHVFFVQVGFLCFCVMSILLTIIIYQMPNYPNVYGHALIVFDVILIGYIILLFFGPDPALDEHSLTIQVIGQKIVVYAEIFCMIFQIDGAKKYISKNGLT